jgi:hypothetical protein
MPFSLKDVVPWGRSFDEYTAMFALSAADLEGRILGCGDGPAAFNAGLTRRGGRVVSVDPIYRFSAEEIRRRIEETYDDVMAEARRNQRDFVWRHIASPEELGRKRMAAMEEFLADYPDGRAEGRYVPGALPALPFSDGSFDLALSSHYLFLYSKFLPLDFHVASIGELCRVARETRLFPLLEFGSRKSRHLEGVVDALRGNGIVGTIETVPYEFQRGGNEMLRVRRRAV